MIVLKTRQTGLSCYIIHTFYMLFRHACIHVESLLELDCVFDHLYALEFRAAEQVFMEFGIGKLLW